MSIGRRIYRAELRRALGYGDTWFRVLQERGEIPRGTAIRVGAASGYGG